MECIRQKIPVLPEDQWIPVTRKFRSNLSPSHVFCRLTIKRKKSGNIPTVKLSIGNEIMELLTWKAGDRMAIHQHPNNAAIFRIRKIPSGPYKFIRQGVGASTCAIEFPIDAQTSLKPDKTLAVDFDIYGDTAIIFNTSKIVEF